jgi:ectoine hydroxylase
LRERSSDSVRSAIAPHLSDELFRRLSLHPRLVEPARTLLGGEVYLHQFKINAKEAHDGEIWHWHQDYRTWYEDDGMPEPTVLNATVFLDDVNEFNGPMMFVPGSHKDGRIDSDQTFERVPEYGRLSADAVGSPYTNETINGLIEKNGIVAPKGVAGSTIFFSWMHDTRFRAEYVSLGKGNGLFKS